MRVDNSPNRNSRATLPLPRRLGSPTLTAYDHDLILRVPAPKPWSVRAGSGHARRVSSPQRRASESSARRPCLSDSLLAPTMRRRVRRSVHAAFGAKSRRRGHPANSSAPRANRRVRERPGLARLRLRQHAMRISVWVNWPPRLTCIFSILLHHFPGLRSHWRPVETAFTHNGEFVASGPDPCSPIWRRADLGSFSGFCWWRVEHLHARFDRCSGFPGAFGADYMHQATPR